MIRLQKAASTLSAVLCLLLVSACNSEGGGTDEEEKGGDSLSELSGLTGVPDNDNWLFYTSNAEGKAGLFAFNPLLPDNGAELIDADAYVSGTPYVFSAISSANVTGSELSDYRASHLFYRSTEEVTLPGSSQTLTQPDGFQRVSASQNVQPPSRTRVSSEANATHLLSTRYFFQNDLDDPLDTAIAYLADDHWRQIRVGDGAGQAPLAFDTDHQVSIPLGNGTPNGWLVIDEANNNRLAMVDMALDAKGPVLDQNDDPVEDLARVDMFVNLGLNSQLVALTFEDPDPSDDDTPEPEIWKYDLGEPGTIEPLLNGQGEKLTFSTGLTGGASLPPADKLVVRDDALYFAHPASAALLFSTGPQLYRVDQDGWSVEASHASDSGSIIDSVPASPFLIDAGERLIWLIGDELKGVDTNDFSESTLYEADSEASTPILDSQGGWFFYNDDGIAVAARTDGSERIQLHDARWIGASSRGAGPVAARLAKSEISEVFLLHDDGTLVAASATDPAAGGVVLGQLDPAPEAVRMFSIRPGPHQLMQVQYDGETYDRYEVVYVDSREPGSLKKLMDEPTDTANGNAGSRTRPVYGH